MKIGTQRLMAALMMASLFTACSRPVAYFQPSQREHFAVAPSTPAPVTEATTPAQPAVAVTTAETTPQPTAQAVQATQVNEALDQVDALVRNDSKLAADKTVQKRLNRIRALATATSAKSSLAPSETATPKKASLMERLMLKKMNKKISKQLAPSNPNKTMVSTGTLATGAVLVIVGLLLLLLASGTGATIGLIALLLGAVVLLFGLL
ncbi:hypothetical protein [Spirosoma oryzicola]|uniref:hypothetical protein n=1 Tax=Spirosoma oryzicola TaxID=2898794 RepID=UPI001E609D68|nr:hypothetical protein [Spirosoma oryzicola]UHG92401.1 hypothetical protein LQ777_05730 [Spirosoma oryzicola]